MLQENLNPPSFRDRAERKLRRLWTAGIHKVTPKSAANNKRFVNAVAWCIHGEVATRVVFFNYFWRNHHEETIKLDIQLIDAKGQELWRDSKLVLQDQTLIVDSADIAKSIGLEEFEGYLAFSSTLSRVPEFIELIRFNVDYYSTSGAISTVHDQAIFAPAHPSIHHSLGKMEVVETKGIGTALIFTNSLAFHATSISARVDVKRHDGESMLIGQFVVSPRAMLRIELGKEQPDLESFLQGKSGQVIVESNFYIKRAAVLQYSKAGLAQGFSVNHSEEYRGNPPYLTRKLSAPAIEGKFGSMAPMPYFHHYYGLTTDFVVFHDVPEAGKQQTYGISLFDESGKLVFQNENIITVPLYGTGRVCLKNYLPGNQGMFGLAQLFLSPYPYNERWADNFPADVHYMLGTGQWDAMYSQGSTSSLNAGEGSRTRVFSRVYYDDQFKTELVLFHASTAADEKSGVSESSTQITICDPTGKIAITREIHLKPFATRIVNIADLFPEIKTFGLRAGSACGIYIRDVKAKIITIHVTRNSENSAIAVDHFYGG